MHRLIRNPRAILATIAFALLQTAALANHDELELFEPVTTPSGREFPAHALGNRARSVRVSGKLLERDRFQLNLFPGHSFQAERERVVDYGNGDFAWVGHILDEPLSRVTFAVRAGVLSGVVDRPVDDGNELFELTPTADGGYMLYQADDRRLPQRAPGVNPAPETSFSGASADNGGGGGVLVEATAAAPVVQDIMVVYTPASVLKYGQSGIESKILQAIADANAAYQNSQVNAQLNLVYLGQVAYAETGDMNAALTALQSAADGKMDEVHSLRNEYGADLVCLVDEDANYCGIAYVMQTVSTSFAGYAFSVVYSGCLSSLTLPHEVGHNQGNQHDRANASFQGAYPYSYGWRRCASDGTGFRTIMSYSCTGGTRIPYFSNPNLTLGGYPLGVAYEVDPANAADNVRSMNNTAATIAAFRNAAVTLPDAPSGLAAVPVASDQVDLTWLDNANNEANYRVERSLDGSAWTEIATLPANTVSFSSTGLNGSTPYSYRVRASNSAGYSPYSNVAGVTTPAATLAAPSSLTAGAISRSQIRLNWTRNSGGETGFAIERSLNGSSGWTQVGTAAADVTTYTDGSLSPATYYYYRVRAFSATAVSGYSNIAYARTKRH